MKRFVLFVASLLSTPAYAGMNGNKLFEACSAQDTSYEGAGALIACNNYIIGVVDGFRMTDAGYKLMNIPKGVTGEQLQAVVLKYLSDNPQTRHLPGSYLVIQAVTAAFPVTNSSK